MTAYNRVTLGGLDYKGWEIDTRPLVSTEDSLKGAIYLRF